MTAGRALWILSVALPALLTGAAGAVRAQEDAPAEWIEPKTGHRVVRLSKEPGSESLYFHQYAFSADGAKVVFTTRRGISTANLQTREIEQVVQGRAQALVTGRKTGDVYYLRGDSVYAADLETHDSRKVAELPAKFHGANVAPNADESLLVVVAYDPAGTATPRSLPPEEADGRLGPRWASGRAMVMYTIDVATGATNVIHRSNDWLNHLQCSPTDPGQILFCHEGPWHYVDRTWLIRTDGSELVQVHPRTMDMEIGGHEFFSADGKTIWYDLQTPRSLVFWLAGYDIETGKRTWYHVPRCEWSVHYNISPDGKWFVGDGGGPASVANRGPSGETLDPPRNGQWIYLFHPEPIGMTGLPEAAAKQVKVAVLCSQRLVDLSNHDYSLEPNAMFSPDGRWIVFRSNMHGASHVYAVEVARADQ